LSAEVREALALCGVTSVTQLDGSFVTPAHPVQPADVLSAFPLLGPAGD
jgi:hypothetical protein